MRLFPSPLARWQFSGGSSPAENRWKPEFRPFTLRGRANGTFTCQDELLFLSSFRFLPDRCAFIYMPVNGRTTFSGIFQKDSWPQQLGEAERKHETLQSRIQVLMVCASPNWPWHLPPKDQRKALNGLPFLSP